MSDLRCLSCLLTSLQSPLPGPSKEEMQSHIVTLESRITALTRDKLALQSQVVDEGVAVVVAAEDL